MPGFDRRRHPIRSTSMHSAFRSNATGACRLAWRFSLSSGRGPLQARSVFVCAPASPRVRPRSNRPSCAALLRRCGSARALSSRRATGPSAGAACGRRGRRADFLLRPAATRRRRLRCTFVQVRSDCLSASSGTPCFAIVLQVQQRGAFDLRRGAQAAQRRHCSACGTRSRQRDNCRRPSTTAHCHVAPISITAALGVGAFA